jgi:DNA (cytosine-5)-methyltransferase 1
LDFRPAAGLDGLIASPPCPEFSSANGKRTGLSSTSGALVWQVLRWADALQPTWIACEQVPQVLPIWQHFAGKLETGGWRTTTGIIDAANYGLPQNRERAILLAHRDYRPPLPRPTHAEYGDVDDLFGIFQPWVTLADALGLEPGWVYDSGQMSTLGGGVRERYVRSCDRPAGTLTGQTRSQWVLKRGDERRKLRFAEACRLQGFPEDYPFTGKSAERDQQLGNAVPPPLAELLLDAVTGRKGLEDVA